MDLRLPAVLYRLEGHTYAETAKIFHVSVFAVRAWVKTVDLSNKPLNRGFKKIDPEKLRTYVEEHPNDTQQEIADEFHCSNQAVSKALKRLNITRKKMRRYKERDETYEETLEPFSKEKRVYVDKFGFNACYDREYGYAPRREKVFGEVSGMKFQRTNLVAAQIGGRIVALMYYDCSTNSAVFEFWFEEKLRPELSPRDIVIMDNAQFHRKRVLPRAIMSWFYSFRLIRPITILLKNCGQT